MVAAQRSITLILVSSVLSTKSVVHGARHSCPKPAIVDLTGESPDSSGFVNKSGNVFPPESIWSENDKPFGCLCDVKACVPLCCPVEYAVSPDGCVEDQFSPNHSRPQEWWNAWTYHLFIDNPCGNVPLNSDVQISPYEWFKDDSIYLPNYSRRVELGNYCVFRVPNSPSYDLALTCMDLELGKLFMCFVVCTTVSILFMLVTFVVYGLVPELRNLQGWILRSFLASYIGGMIVFTSFVLQDEFPIDINELESGYASLYFGLACSMWLNLMSYDIWQKFRECRSSRDAKSKKEQRARFAWYSIYAWGASTAPLAMLFISTMWLKAMPHYEESMQRYIDAFLTIGPILGIFICICCLYISTALTIRQHEQETASMNQSVDKHHQENKEWFILCVKLFLIMGCHLILWAIAFYWDCYAFTIFVLMLEALKGVSVFVMFVWKDDVKRSIRKRFVKILRGLGFFLRHDAPAVTGIL